MCASQQTPYRKGHTQCASQQTPYRKRHNQCASQQTPNRKGHNQCASQQTLNTRKMGEVSHGAETNSQYGHKALKTEKDCNGNRINKHSKGKPASMVCGDEQYARLFYSATSNTCNYFILRTSSVTILFPCGRVV